MIKQPGILITRNTFHINDTRRFKSVHFQDIKSNSVSQAITEPRAQCQKIGTHSVHVGSHKKINELS